MEKSSGENCNIDLTGLMAACFSKTPPPPRLRRPQRDRYRTHSYNRRGFLLYLNRNQRSGKCWSCGKAVHFRQHCFRKHKYIQKLNAFKHAGSAAEMLIDILDGISKTGDDLDEVAAFLTYFKAPGDESGETDSWLANLLET